MNIPPLLDATQRLILEAIDTLQQAQNALPSDLTGHPLALFAAHTMQRVDDALQCATGALTDSLHNISHLHASITKHLARNPRA